MDLLQRLSNDVNRIEEEGKKAINDSQQKINEYLESMFQNGNSRTQERPGMQIEPHTTQPPTTNPGMISTPPMQQPIKFNLFTKQNDTEMTMRNCGFPPSNSPGPENRNQQPSLTSGMLSTPTNLSTNLFSTRSTTPQPEPVMPQPELVMPQPAISLTGNQDSVQMTEQQQWDYHFNSFEAQIYGKHHFKRSGTAKDTDNIWRSISNSIAGPGKRDLDYQEIKNYRNATIIWLRNNPNFRSCIGLTTQQQMDRIVRGSLPCYDNLHELHAAGLAHNRKVFIHQLGKPRKELTANDRTGGAGEIHVAMHVPQEGEKWKLHFSGMIFHAKNNRSSSHPPQTITQSNPLN